MRTILVFPVSLDLKQVNSAYNNLKIVSFITECCKRYIIIDFSAPVFLKEDVNRDGAVNVLDLVSVANNFGHSGENIADVNGDNSVHVLDLVTVAGAFGQTP